MTPIEALMLSEYDSRPIVDACEAHPSRDRQYEAATLCLSGSRAKFLKNAPAEFVRGMVLATIEDIV